jgi:hypothetical protein
MVASGHMERAAIAGRDGAVWARSSGTKAAFRLTSQEVVAISRGFDEPAALRRRGLSIGGRAFDVVSISRREVVSRSGWSLSLRGRYLPANPKRFWHPPRLNHRPLWW